MANLRRLHVKELPPYGAPVSWRGGQDELVGGAVEDPETRVKQDV